MCRQPASEESEQERFIGSKSIIRNTDHCSGSLVINEFVATTQSTFSVQEALFHLDPIVAKPHVSGFSKIKPDIAAESDDVVAAGDGGEDARLDVHRTIATCVNIV